MKKKPVGKIIVIVWLALSTLYVVYGEYSRLANYVARSAYDQGFRDSLTQLVSEVNKCENPIPVTIDSQTVNLMGVECVQKAAMAQNMVEGGESSAPAEN